MHKYFFLLTIVFLLVACSKPEKAPIEVLKIDSKQLIDSLISISDTTFTDTADYTREPKAKLFIQSEEQLKHQVFSDSLGNVLNWIIFKDTVVEYVQRYFSNGQYWNKVNYDEAGMAHGEYKFYFPNGQLKMRGEYVHGKEVTEKRVLYNKEGYKIEKK